MPSGDRQGEPTAAPTQSTWQNLHQIRLYNLDPELPGLLERILAAGKAPVSVAHFGHVGEVCEDAIKNVRKLRDGGVQFPNQAVLLSKVNEDAEVLAATFAKR